jgi:hypothetical protein
VGFIALLFLFIIKLIQKYMSALVRTHAHETCRSVILAVLLAGPFRYTELVSLELQGLRLEVIGETSRDRISSLQTETATFGSVIRDHHRCCLPRAACAHTLGSSRIASAVQDCVRAVQLGGSVALQRRVLSAAVSQVCDCALY